MIYDLYFRSSKRNKISNFEMYAEKKRHFIFIFSLDIERIQSTCSINSYIRWKSWYSSERKLVS